MKKIKLILILVIVLGAGVPFAVMLHKKHHHPAGAQKTGEIYYCSMHPTYTSDRLGSCPICGMNLTKMESEPAEPASEKVQSDEIAAPHSNGARNDTRKKILFYRNPMNPEVTSPVPAKDEMGMDYVPVYEEETKQKGVYINPEKQQLIGVRTEAVGKKRLVHEINTVGRVAYDPELYVAQEEYVQALKNFQEIQKGGNPEITEQTRSLINAAQKKLLLLGMTDDEIMELAKRGKAQSNLYLPGKDDRVWVYISVYEYEFGLIKEGQEIEAEALAYPGEKFYGRIISFTPVLDNMSRSVKVRALLEDDSRRLLPQMFVNVKINVEIGTRLAVPQEAVMDTGERKIVFVVKGEGTFETRSVMLGAEAKGYFEVIDGLEAGETVVTSGNFLIDSESKLKAALSKAAEHQH